MNIKETLAINSLRKEIIEISSVLRNLEKFWDGKSWKYPNIKSENVDIPAILQKVSYDKADSTKCQLGLLEILVDRLHFLILSCSGTEDISFCTLGKSAEYLINRTKLLNERPISAGYVGGDGDRGSTETYSPNYEEDVRREMFPFIQSLIISVYGICNKYVIPCTSHQAWHRENKNLTKNTFVTITSAIRDDIDRMGKIFENFSKQKEILKNQISKEQMETKKYKLSAEGVKATMSRERLELHGKLQIKENLHTKEKAVLEDQISILSEKISNLENDLKNTCLTLTRSESKCKKQNFITEELTDTKIIIENNFKILQNNFEEISKQLKGQKISNQKMKSKLLELSEYETLSIKSTQENSTLSLKLTEAAEMVENLRVEIQLERSNSQRYISSIEKFKLKIKNATSCTRCCNFPTEIDILKNQLINVSETSETKTFEINELKMKLNSQVQESDKWSEKARLLAAYPDLTPDVPPAPIESSVQGQMKAQLKSNELRINLLKTENQKLRSAIEKLISRPEFDDELLSEHLENVDFIDNDPDFDEVSLPSSLTRSVQPSVRPVSVRSIQNSGRYKSRRITSPLYPSRSHTVNSGMPCVQWNSGPKQ